MQTQRVKEAVLSMCNNCANPLLPFIGTLHEVTLHFSYFTTIIYFHLFLYIVVHLVQKTIYIKYTFF